MRKVFISCMVVFFVCAMSGCKLFKKKKARAPQVSPVSKVSSVELAHEILRPKPYKFKTTRDPFRPVIERKHFSSQGLPVDEPEEMLEAKVIGIVLLGEAHTALIETASGVKVFKRGDMIDSYVIDKIEGKIVVLKKGSNEVVLKVGGEENE